MINMNINLRLRFEHGVDSVLSVLIARRWISLAALTAIVCVCAAGIPRLRVDNTMNVWFSGTIPFYQQYTKLTDRFGSDQYLFVAVEPENLFSQDGLKSLDTLSAQFQKIDGVDEVIDLPTSALVRADDDEIIVRELRDQIDAWTPERIRAEILDDERFAANVISRDGKVAVFLVRCDRPEKIRPVVAAVEKIIEAGHVPAQLGGYLFASREMDRLTIADISRFSVLCPLLLSAIFIALFRDTAMTLAFLADMAFSIAAVAGLMGLADTPFHLLTGALPALIMVMAIADDVHICERFRRTTGASAGERARKAAVEVAFPCLMTSVTTFAGFGSLVFSDVPAIAHFGFWSAAGIFLTWVISFTVVPILLSFSSRPVIFDEPASRGRLDILYRAADKHGGKIICAFLFLFLVSLAGMRRIDTDTQMTNFFKEDSLFLRSMYWIEARFGHTGPLEIVFESEQTDGLKDPEFLAKLDGLIERVREHPQIETVTSVVPMIKTMNQALFGGGPDAYRLPDNRPLLEQELLLLSMSDAGERTLRRFVDSGWSHLRVQIRMPIMTNRQALALFDNVEAQTRKIFGNSVSFHLTGVVHAYSKLDNYILRIQLGSLAIALFVIALCIWAQVGSPLLGLLGLIPNLVPVGLMFGFMAWTGITLNVATATVAAISLGIAVDDTIHFLFGYRRARLNGKNARQAVDETLVYCGRALTLTTLLNISGFLLFTMSNFKPTVYFGVLTTWVWAAALVCDLLLLPALLIRYDRDP